ncbi:uncharacterized protein LOC119674162 [Teleopsis dalmanni]|uniref:uncharacterized protein LOC119674162 n=1 Tax=Teleopsis dalmanni TaxID=139649 RepID=UPI0018CE54FD|nr:uncharacterized protein LOC119674162 [Teleopsis dalmanni]
MTSFRFTFVWLTVLLSFLISRGYGDDSPGFFLKTISKNIPRLGRRSDKEFESSFFKNMKSIPRIGRAATTTSKSDLNDLIAWFSNDLPILNKRMLLNPAAVAAADREYSVVQPVNSNTLIELIDKDAIPSDNVKFVHWKDFDRALQFDMDLYEKVFSLGRRPDQRLKQDLSIGSYIPLLSNTNNVNDDYMLYNRGGSGVFDRDILRYNHLK